MLKVEIPKEIIENLEVPTLFSINSEQIEETEKEKANKEIEIVESNTIAKYKKTETKIGEEKINPVTNELKTKLQLQDIGFENYSMVLFHNSRVSFYKIQIPLAILFLCYAYVVLSLIYF